jgi:hypothetical protein
MFELVSKGISGASATTIDWVKTPDELVAGVEEVFPAIKDREKNEKEILDDIWEAIEGILEEIPEGETIAWLLKRAAKVVLSPALAYGEANDEIKRKSSPMPFAVGVVMGVMAERRMDFMRDRFWQSRRGEYPQNEYGGLVEQYYHNGALALGLSHGRMIENNPVFFADIQRDGGPGMSAVDGEDWGQWEDFYYSVGGQFVKLHIPLAYG